MLLSPHSQSQAEDTKTIDDHGRRGARANCDANVEEEMKHKLDKPQLNITVWIFNTQNVCHVTSCITSISHVFHAGCILCYKTPVLPYKLSLVGFPFYFLVFSNPYAVASAGCKP
jgi:hypothetical protein